MVKDLHEQVATNTANIKNIDKKVDNIELQVTNHIPTSIKELGNKIEALGKSNDKKVKGAIDECEEKYSRKWVEVSVVWAIRIVISMIIIALMGLVIIK